MFKKGTKLYSISNNKCPRCHEGDFYAKKGIFRFKNLLKLNDNCSHCDLKYMMEPSFFYGAMYVNYGLTVAVSVATFIISKVIIGLTVNQSFLSIIAALIIFIPIGLRLSRLIWINMFVSYDKKFDKKN
ncbi:DUF983 domain-containing protein [Urechidicola croceus]|uniref:DUF983 domain-containing protein n=1 Tax=Urechidicola croceus TaxID=1850246 RepID=A0A1D8PAS4_9FLAO|nr:DUF983 domain-containing protein [Urechidicola croceus]AOW21683.1 DUF983 domain-containing protein [Urechidicola croceus]